MTSRYKGRVVMQNVTVYTIMGHSCFIFRDRGGGGPLKCLRLAWLSIMCKVSAVATESTRKFVSSQIGKFYSKTNRCQTMYLNGSSPQRIQTNSKQMRVVEQTFVSSFLQPCKISYFSACKLYVLYRGKLPRVKTICKQISN